MLDYKVYREKLDKLEAAEREFEQEERLWEERLLEFANFFKKNNFLLKFDKAGKYQYTSYYDFCPARYMSHNIVTVTEESVSMVGIDCDNDEIGVMNIKMDDFFRKDYEKYFLDIYKQLREEENRQKIELKEKEEKKLYEELRKKYGDG